MGKIFGISDLPVSTIMTPFEPVYCPVVIQKPLEKVFNGKVDNKFLPKQGNKVSNYVIKMRYGIGKLMKHFSGKNSNYGGRYRT